MISNKLKIERARAGITLIELSLKSDVTVQTIHRIEKGVTKPGLVTLGKLARGLNIDVIELLYDKNE